MPGTIPTLIAAIRKRPEHERRILAATVYLAGCAIILALGVASIQQTLSLGGNRSTTPAAGELTSAQTSVRTSASASESEPAGPFQALQGAFSTAVSESKNLIAELGRTGTLVAESAEPTTRSDLFKGDAPPPASLLKASPAAPKTSPTALPEEKKSASHLLVTEPTGPAKTIAEAVGLPLYSSYATARLLALPLEAKIRQPDPESAKKTSYIGEVVSYNLGELRRTAKDVYHYFLP